ncbi:MAG: hypothetical protein Q8J76_15390, partial [Desulfobulbaceae bacterium]|nr:hypothetical protein [Desulfobulbaceae bacterium]
MQSLFSPRPVFVSLICCLLILLGRGGIEAQAGGCANGSCHANIIGFAKLHNPVESGECEACH